MHKRGSPGASEDPRRHIIVTSIRPDAGATHARLVPKLLPREDKFFDLFEQHSAVVVKGAEALRALLDGGEGVPRHYQTIMDREQEADNITPRHSHHGCAARFIHRFDRSDIQDLTTSMDDAIDQMQKTAKVVDPVRGQRDFEPHMREMGDDHRRGRRR